MRDTTGSKSEWVNDWIVGHVRAKCLFQWQDGSCYVALLFPDDFIAQYNDKAQREGVPSN